jgi:hypothetical protein
VLTLLLASLRLEDALLDIIVPAPCPAPLDPTHAPESGVGCKSGCTSTSQELERFDSRFPPPESA